MILPNYGKFIALTVFVFVCCIQPLYSAKVEEQQEQRPASEIISSTATNLLDTLNKKGKPETPVHKSVITDSAAEITKQRESVSITMKEIIADVDAKITKQREETAKQIKEITADIDAKLAKQKVFTWITLILVIISDVLYIFIQFLPNRR